MEPLQGISLVTQNTRPASSDSAKAGQSFGDIISNMVGEVNTRHQEADQAIQQVHAGGERNLHEAMIAMEKADVSLRYMAQVRNKALEAYQEIMRLQV